MRSEQRYLGMDFNLDYPKDRKDQNIDGTHN
jgi:hypothetical protein